MISLAPLQKKKKKKEKKKGLLRIRSHYGYAYYITLVAGVRYHLSYSRSW